MREFTAASLFCGAGGLDIGFVKPIRCGRTLPLYAVILVRLMLRIFQTWIYALAGFHAKDSR